MILIFGGAYQGKRAYAQETLGYKPDQIVGDVALLIRDMLAAGEDPVEKMPALCEQWQDMAVLLGDISCGVVPMSAEERAWREAVGRCGSYLARHAQQVVRVFCGIGTVIKDA